MRHCGQRSTTKRQRLTTSRIDEGQTSAKSRDCETKRRERVHFIHNSVRLGFLGFWGENPPNDPPFSGSGGRDQSQTVTGVESASSQAGLDGLGGWVGPRFLLDTSRLEVGEMH